ncbi:rCG49087 [Rattus norvegicus]|uniref:RCG49087 n=1 Tax=Rattus norvegicus TaxID=10116 RepID=A6IGL3_RAT|nr:rCG49087 [Rattus norvegicus]
MCRNNQYSLRNQLYLFIQRVPENNSCSHRGGGRDDVTLGRVMSEISPSLKVRWWRTDVTGSLRQPAPLSLL